MQGTKHMGQTNTRDNQEAFLVEEVATKTGYSKRYIRMVIRNERKNEYIMSVYMLLLEDVEKAKDGLLAAVKELVPFPTSKTKPSTI